MKNWHKGCLGCAIPFFGAVAIYIFVRTVPAGWYMPRQYTSMIIGSATGRSCLGLKLRHFIEYHDYNFGILYLLNKGPALRYEVETEMVANIRVGSDLSLSPVGVMAARQPEHISSVMAWDNTIAYEATGKDDSTRLALFNGAKVRMIEGKEFRDPSVLQLDDEDIILGGQWRLMRFGRHLTESEWAFFRKCPRMDPCHIPRTCSTSNMDAAGAGDVTLYTALPGGGLSTNVYPCPLSNMGLVTAMGTPEDPYFASFDRIHTSRSYSTVSNDRVIYTIWNQRGVIRVIDVPAGIFPEAEVCPYEADGKRYMVYLYDKTTERHKVTVGVTFVDLESGQQTQRDVTIQIPKDSLEVKP